VRLALKLHPDSPCDAVTSIEVDVVRPRPDLLGLRYVVSGCIADLAVPAKAPSGRADELWEHTCFEAFLREDHVEGYSELNVSPSTEWAGYWFGGYRSGMQIAHLPPPRVEVELSDEALEVRVALRLRPGPGRRIGLSAIIEERSGAKSYWALAHPPGAPDFHHPDCFAVELPPLG
jgi:hypothetical protein